MTDGFMDDGGMDGWVMDRYILSITHSVTFRYLQLPLSNTVGLRGGGGLSWVGSSTTGSVGGRGVCRSEEWPPVSKGPEGLGSGRGGWGTKGSTWGHGAGGPGWKGEMCSTDGSLELPFISTSPADGGNASQTASSNCLYKTEELPYF